MREIIIGMGEALGLRENYSEEEDRNVMHKIDIREYFPKVTGLSFNKKTLSDDAYAFIKGTHKTD